METSITKKKSNYYARAMYMRLNYFKRGVLNVKSETFLYPHCNNIRLPGQLTNVIKVALLRIPRLVLAQPEQLRCLVRYFSHFLPHYVNLVWLLFNDNVS